jgi:prevent-host-death family protein
MEMINVHQAKTHFASLMQRALNGEEIIVAKHGKPLIRLVPVNTSKRQARQFGRHPQTLEPDAQQRALSPLTEDELGDWTTQ